MARQGLKVLGIPIDRTEYVREFLDRKTRQQEVLFQHIPSLNDTQAAFLLLTMCGAIRANFWMLAVRPEDTEDYARRHDANVWTCFQEITGIPHAPATPHVPSTCHWRQVAGSGKCSSRACRSSCGSGRLWPFWANPFWAVVFSRPT